MTHVTPYDNRVTIDMTHDTTCNKHIRLLIIVDMTHCAQHATSTFDIPVIIDMTHVTTCN